MGLSGNGLRYIKYLALTFYQSQWFHRQADLKYS
jgi:hypothetical protein